MIKKGVLGAIIGLFIGGFFFAVVALYFGPVLGTLGRPLINNSHPHAFEEAAILGALIVVVIGSLIGALIGAGVGIARK